MSTVRKVTINANHLVSTLYPGLRGHLKRVAPFLDEHFGNHLADQSIRHVVHRITTYKSEGTFEGAFPESDAIFLAKQMQSVGCDLGNTIGADGVVIDLLNRVQLLALQHVRSYELKNRVEITGQTP